MSKMSFREHETLSHLLDLLPSRAQKGLMTTTIEWTSMDASKQFIVLGANISLVYVYDRSEHTIIRLRLEDKSCNITCVKLQSSLDYQIAAGTNKGHVELYLLPSKAPGKGKEVKRMFLKGLHKGKVTCASWSTNGMKLFTGDDLGCVVYTEVDFYENHHHSTVVLQEPDPIVQLNYAHKTLLVSTTSRALLCYPSEGNRCQQVGSQSRKIKGNFGAMFIPAMCKPSDATLYATRPGLRLWKAEMSGSVTETILFKEWLLKGLSEIKLLPRTAVEPLGIPAEIQFGRLDVVSQSLVVVWSSSSLFILDPSVEGESAIMGRSHGQLGSILAVTALDDEILVLRKGSKQSVIRLGLGPEAEIAKEVFHFSVKEESYLQSLEFPGTMPSSKPHRSEQPTTQAVIKDSFSTFKNVFKKAADEIADGASKAKEGIEQNARSLKLKLDHLGEDGSHGAAEGVGCSHEMDSRKSGDTQAAIITPDTPVPIDSAEQIILKDSKGKKEPGVSSGLLVVEETDGERTPLEGTPRGGSPLPGAVPAPTTPILNLQDLQEISQQKYDDIVLTKPKKRKKRKKQDAGSRKDGTDTADTPPPAKENGSPHSAIQNEPIEGTKETLEEAGHPASDVTSVQDKDVISERDSGVNTGPADRTGLNPSPNEEPQSHDLSCEQTCNNNVSQSEVGEDEELHVGTESDDGGFTVLGRKGTDDIHKTPNDSIRDDDISEEGAVSTPREMSRFNQTKLNLTDPRSLHSYESGTDLPESDMPMSVCTRNRPFSVYQDIYGGGRSSEWDGADPLTGLAEEGEGVDSDSDSETESQELDQGDLEDLTITENLQQQLSSSWLQCTTPGYITKMAASERHVWCVDSRERVYSSLSTKLACSWHKLKRVRAREVAVSPSGNIVWIRDQRNRACASNPVLPNSKVGSRWNVVCERVVSLCLDETTGWIIHESGDVLVHTGITRERPYTHAKKVSTKYQINSIVANRGVVWALTSEDKVMYRAEVSINRPQGKSWKELNGSSELKAVSIALDSKHMGWAIDKEGRVWFRTGVNLENPEGGDKRWWQVTVSEYLMEDPNVLKVMVNLAGNATRFDRVVSWLNSHQAIDITANSSGVWVCAQFRKCTTLQVSRGNLLGSSWETCIPVGLPSATCWVSLSAAAAYGPSGTIWATQKSGEVFCFPPTTLKPTLVNPPERVRIIQVSAHTDVVWALSDTGCIHIRLGISDKCPQGKEWRRLDMSQLGSNKIVHISCGRENVWACDANGNCYMRVGVDLPKHDSLPRAWLTVESRDPLHFTQVCAGATDNMVWAIDSRKTVYSRRGVSKDLPVGLEWVMVEGTHAHELCISAETVWALCLDGDIACRFGTSQTNAEGNYWKKVPGNFAHISVSQTDDLWSINREGQLLKRAVKVFKRQHFDSPSLDQPAHELDEDWELL